MVDAGYSDQRLIEALLQKFPAERRRSNNSLTKGDATMPQLFWFISVFGIIATIFRSRIPGLKVPPFPMMIPHSLVTMAYTVQL